ncbi:uncharacterized protein LOC132739502 [Ruditapes philippinarum]|uniref:uncharacterized protein LOC132739502 n=1 Tax=Ruditapes philippinarum TaxID=129788 RepID=UPI00295B3734|nr:uncharacterized protein LOC132739502 [Ruditapes philippinarum]
MTKEEVDLTLFYVYIDDIRISKNPDRKVAIDEFPSDRYLNVGNLFGRDTYVRLTRQCEYVFTSMIEGFDGFQTIEEYVTHWFNRRKMRKLGFLVTVGVYSHGIVINGDGSVSLFDSHGQLKYEGKLITSLAGALNFPSVKELAVFLISMYGEGRSAAIALVSVRSPGSSRRGVCKNATDHEQAEFGYQPFCMKATDTSASYILPEIQIEGENVNENVKVLEEDDVSPYVMLLGGGT